MVDVILRSARTSYFKGLMWYPIRSYIATLLDDEIPPSLNLAVVLTSPHASWSNVLDGPKAVIRWVTVPRLGWSVVDALLRFLPSTPCDHTFPSTFGSGYVGDRLSLTHPEDEKWGLR